MRPLVFAAALGVVLSGCSTPKVNDPQSTAIAIATLSAVATIPSTFQGEPMPGPWRITKTEWTKEDEVGFGEFLRVIAESG